MAKEKRFSFMLLSILLIVFLLVGLIGCDDPDKVPDEVKKTITFESNGGSKVDAITAIIGTEVKAPAEPTKEGFIFEGWYKDDKTFASKYEFSVMPEENLTLYAKWKAVAAGEVHVFGDWSIVTKPTKDKEGKAMRACTNKNCGYKESKVLPKLDETNYTYSLVKQGNCGELKEEKYVLKSDESIVVNVNNIVLHQEKWQYDENSHWKICTSCNNLLMDKLDHRFEEKTDENGNKIHVCKDCGYVQGSAPSVDKPYNQYQYVIDVMPTPYFDGVKHTNLDCASNNEMRFYSIPYTMEKIKGQALIDSSLISKDNYKEQLKVVAFKTFGILTGTVKIEEATMGPLTTITYKYGLFAGSVNMVDSYDNTREYSYYVNTVGGVYELIGDTYSFKPNELFVQTSPEGIKQGIESDYIYIILTDPNVKYVSPTHFTLKMESMFFDINLTESGVSIIGHENSLHGRIVMSFDMSNYNGYEEIKIPCEGKPLRKVNPTFSLTLERKSNEGEVMHTGCNFTIDNFKELDELMRRNQYESFDYVDSITGEHSMAYREVLWYTDKNYNTPFNLAEYKKAPRDMIIYGKYGDVIPESTCEIYIDGEKVDTLRGYSYEDIHFQVEDIGRDPEMSDAYIDPEYTTKFNPITTNKIPKKLYFFRKIDRQFEFMIGGNVVAHAHNRVGDEKLGMPPTGYNQEMNDDCYLPTTWYVDPQFTKEFKYNEYKNKQFRMMKLYGKEFGEKVPTYTITIGCDQIPHTDPFITEYRPGLENLEFLTYPLYRERRVLGWYADAEKTTAFDVEAYIANPKDITIYVELEDREVKYDITIMCNGKVETVIPYFSWDKELMLPFKLDQFFVKEYFMDAEFTTSFDRYEYVKDPKNITIYANVTKEDMPGFSGNVRIYDLNKDHYYSYAEFEYGIGINLEKCSDRDCYVYEYYLDRYKTIKFDEKEFMKYPRQDITIYRFNTEVRSANAKKITRQFQDNIIDSFYYDTTYQGEFTLDHIGYPDGGWYTDKETTKAFDIDAWNANPVDITLYSKVDYH